MTPQAALKVLRSISSSDIDATLLHLDTKDAVKKSSINDLSAQISKKCLKADVLVIVVTVPKAKALL